MVFIRTAERGALLARLAPHPPRPPQEVNSRAGRNLPAAIGTAVILLTIVALTIAFRIELFILLVCLFFLAGLWEVAGAFLARSIKIPPVPIMVGGIAMVASTWFISIETGFIAYFITAATTMLWSSIESREGSVTDGISGLLALSWVGLFGMFAVALAKMDSAAFAIIALIMLPVANDTGGWLAGITFGKHPIAASISPKKSWEGFAGSLLASVLISFLTVGLLLDTPWHYTLLIGLLTPIFATAGDFAESLLKRDLGVKDMGSIFPGHGGVLDRIDSILFCAPMLYVVLTIAQ